MLKQIAFAFLMLFAINLNAQKNADCHQVNYLDTDSEIIVNGNLEKGCEMSLDWAQKSSVACFPGTRFIEFQGNHILYSVQMPPASDIKITVTPKSKKTRINLYALRLGGNNGNAPPELSRAISCEASYPKWAGKPNLRAPSKSQSVEFMSIQKSYNIVIGVAGAKGVTAGDYELKIEINQR